MIMVVFILSAFIAFGLFGLDKRRAVKHSWRISENTLLIFSVFGGIGSLLGMLLFRHKTRKWKFRILVPLFAFLDAALLLFLLWTSEYYHAGNTAAAKMQSDGTVRVEKTGDGWLFDGPSEENILIFYPGAKVEATAYAPLLHTLAAKGMDVCLMEMPLRLAFLGINKAGAVLKENSYRHYYIGGHSLGGAMASYYAAEHESSLSGLVLLAAYPVKETKLDTLLVYGSEDEVLHINRVEEAGMLISGRYRELVIQGGNHAQFGDYGPQSGDGQGLISGQKQQRQTMDAIGQFFSVW